jgi:hypothetical protein
MICNSAFVSVMVARTVAIKDMICFMMAVFRSARFYARKKVKSSLIIYEYLVVARCLK